MGCDESAGGGGGTNSSSTSSSPNGKRARDPEDEIYLDNFHSQKRYLSEIMANSLNGLKVGDSHPVPENAMESPARDDICYSPMSEDSEDSRYCDTPLTTSTSSQADAPLSTTISPAVSPQRHQQHKVVPSPASPTTNPYYFPGCTLFSVACGSHSRQRGGTSDSEGRFPSSPNDMCHTADLRRAALLRSVQMRTQPQHYSPAYEQPFTSGLQQNIQTSEEDEDCSSKIFPKVCGYFRTNGLVGGISNTDHLHEVRRGEGWAALNS